jgi:hypothetical protein
MGGFLTLAGIARVEQDDIERELRACAEKQGRRFAPDPEGLSLPDGLVITPGKPARLSILLPGSLAESMSLAQQLSTKLKTPVFLFHIHDGDFWMYWLFANGRQIDQFNPIPITGESLSRIASWKNVRATRRQSARTGRT